MIGESLYTYFYQTKGKRGISVVDKKTSTIYLFILILMVIFPILIFLVENNLYLLGPFFVVFCLFIYFNHRVDKILENEKIKEIPKSKKKINKFLKTYGVNHSAVYKEIATQLEIKSAKQKRVYNLYPQINMILPVAILLLSLVASENLEHLVVIFAIAISLIVVCLSLNPLLNLYSDILFNTKSERMLRLSYLVNEIYLDELIKENYPKMNSQKYKSDIEKEKEMF